MFKKNMHSSYSKQMLSEFLLDTVFYKWKFRVKSSLLSLELSFSFTAVVRADNFMLRDNLLRGSIIKNYFTRQQRK